MNLSTLPSHQRASGYYWPGCLSYSAWLCLGDNSQATHAGQQSEWCAPAPVFVSKVGLDSENNRAKNTRWLRIWCRGTSFKIHHLLTTELTTPTNCFCFLLGWCSCLVCPISYQKLCCDCELRDRVSCISFLFLSFRRLKRSNSGCTTVLMKPLARSSRRSLLYHIKVVPGTWNTVLLGHNLLTEGQCQSVFPSPVGNFHLKFTK